MNQDLKEFVAQWLRVATMAVVPVVMAAFVCIPLALGGHPGERSAAPTGLESHMS